MKKKKICYILFRSFLVFGLAIYLEVKIPSYRSLLLISFIYLFSPLLSFSFRFKPPPRCSAADAAAGARFDFVRESRVGSCGIGSTGESCSSIESIALPPVYGGRKEGSKKHFGGTAPISSSFCVLRGS